VGAEDGLKSPVEGVDMHGSMAGGLVSDRAIASAVRRIVGSAAVPRRAHLRLNVASGWVILHGEVRDRAAWDELVRAVAAIDGVKGVDDRAVGRVVKRVQPRQPVITPMT
jgi:osmotically-inducible protein OsmY